MFIDIHAHAYRRPVPFVTKFCSVEELIQRYDDADIEKGFVLPIVSPEIYLPQANEDILDMAAAYPERIIPFCNLDPRALTNSADAPLGDVLRYYRDLGCRGIGEIMPNLRMLDPLVQNLFRHAEEVGLPVTTDGSLVLGSDFGLVDEVGLPQLEYTLARFPELKMIAHGPIFWGELGGFSTPAQRKPIFKLTGCNQTHFFAPTGPIQQEGVAPKLLRRFPNLYGELSDATGVLNCDRTYAAKFLTEFQDKLFFGTDICNFHQKFKLRDLLLELKENNAISETVFNKIARENAIKFFNL